MKSRFKLVFAVLLFISVNSVLAQTQLCSNPKCHGGKIYCEECDYSGIIICKKCDGSGKVAGNVCSQCKGTGKLSCTICNGNGYYPCPDSNGRGNIGNSNNSINTGNNTFGNIGKDGNNNSTRRQFTCPDCKGEKYVPEPCHNPDCHNGAIYCEKCNYVMIK